MPPLLMPPLLSRSDWLHRSRRQRWKANGRPGCPKAAWKPCVRRCRHSLALKPQLIDQLLPALRILGLAVVAGVSLKITAAVLSSINELPLLGRLLQLVGLVAAIQFLSRNALQQQQRAALLARIQQLKLDVLG